MVANERIAIAITRNLIARATSGTGRVVCTRFILDEVGAIETVSPGIIDSFILIVLIGAVNRSRSSTDCEVPSLRVRIVTLTEDVTIKVSKTLSR